MNAAVFVAGGSGPRERALCAELIAQLDAGFSVETLDDTKLALERAAQSAGPCVLIDARVGVDDGFTAFARTSGDTTALARGPRGEKTNGIAAIRSDSGRALVELALSGRQSPEPALVGAWLDWSREQSAPLPRNGLAVRVHANGWSYSGYATASRHLMLGMANSGVDVTWLPDWPEPPVEHADIVEEDRVAMRALLKRPDLTSPAIVYNTPTFPDGKAVLSIYRNTLEQGPLIAATMFETDGIPARWVEPLNTCDRIWVPTAFNRATFADCGVDEALIDVVPIGLDIENYPLDGEPLDLPQARGFVFLSIFEWRLRKGYDVLLRAWARAFTNDDNVCLVIRTQIHQRDVSDELSDTVRSLGLDGRGMAPIVLLPKKIAQPQMASLYRRADAFVVPSRGEAFGIPYLEAMALGIPTIGTAHGGATDFLSARTAYPIEAAITEVDYGYARNAPLYRAQRWAEPSVDATARAMRDVFDHPDEARRRAARGAALARTTFNRHAAGKVAAQALSRVVGRPRTRRKMEEGIAEYYAIAHSLAGYGSESRSFLTALAAVGASVTLRSLSYEDAPELLRADESRLLNRFAHVQTRENRPVLFHLLPVQVSQLPPGRPSIVRTMEETDGLAEGWAQACNRFTEVWVPSSFNFETFARAGVDHRKLRIVPGAIDTDFWSPDNGGLDIEGSLREFRFLSLFDWMSRKGWDVLLTAYCRAFRRRDNVSLTLKYTDLVARAGAQQLNAQEQIAAFQARMFPERHRAGDLPSVLPIEQRLTDQELAQFYGSHDVFVVPSRAEGWGRAHFEAMACGMPTIGTRWGGNLAFMNDENSYLVDVKAMVPAGRDTTRYQGRNWAEPDVEHLESLLRHVYERPSEARARGAAARRHIVAGFSLPVVGKILRERFEMLAVAPGRAPSEELVEPSQLAVIVTNAELPTFERCATHLSSFTRSPYSVTRPGCDPAVTFEGALSAAMSARYVAVLTSDVAVGPAWDQILIDAIESRQNAALAVPALRTATGPQRPEPTPYRYNEDSVGALDRFALNHKLLLSDRGAFATQVAASCAMFDGPALRAILAGVPLPRSFAELLRLALARVGRAWVAGDAYVHDEGSASNLISA
ncbi:MAG TPA: glycosyltransferase [Candidatus Binatia bacterium]|nr:glycosyltransferase [Candidatus Binatia bacterium]